MSKKEVIWLFGMSAKEVAQRILYLFGKIRLEILEYVVKRVGISKVARAAGKKPQSVATAIYKSSLGDDLGYTLFKAIAENWPEILKAAIVSINEKYKEEYKKLGIDLDKLFEEKVLVKK